MLHIRPDPGLTAQECNLRVSIQPLRLNVDQVRPGDFFMALMFTSLLDESTREGPTSTFSIPLPATILSSIPSSAPVRMFIPTPHDYTLIPYPAKPTLDPQQIILEIRNCRRRSSVTPRSQAHYRCCDYKLLACFSTIRVIFSFVFFSRNRQIVANDIIIE